MWCCFVSCVLTLTPARLPAGYVSDHAGCGDRGRFRLGSRNMFVVFHVLAGCSMLTMALVSPASSDSPGGGDGKKRGKTERRERFVVGDHGDNIVVFAACVALESACFGGVNSVAPGLARQLFSPKNSQSVYAVMLTATALGGFIFPNLVALCWQGTGSYDAYLCGGGMLALSGAATSAMVRPLGRAFRVQAERTSIEALVREHAARQSRGRWRRRG